MYLDDGRLYCNFNSLNGKAAIPSYIFYLSLYVVCDILRIKPIFNCLMLLSWPGPAVIFLSVLLPSVIFTFRFQAHHYISLPVQGLTVAGLAIFPVRRSGFRTQLLSFSCCLP